MRLLCRYAGGLACLVAVIALVGCGQATGRKAVDLKPIPDVKSLKIGSTHTVSLVGTFSGEKLTYSTKSSNEAVATAKVDGVHLTVTGVGSGTATITVTATDPQKRSAEDKFTVTVPQPPAQDPMEIQDFTFGQEQTPRTIHLGDKFSGENLTYTEESSDERVATATVDNTADTLTVTAVGPGTATITVTATATAQGSTPQTKTFTVTVPQPASEETAPTVKTGATSTVSVAVGATSTVALSTVFDGATSYDVSSASTIATANVSNEILSIGGVSAGSATVTVTGTNTAGSTAHPISVTVTAPATPTTPAPQEDCSLSGSLTISLRIQRGDNVQCTLPTDKHALVYESNENKVRIGKPSKSAPKVWTITALKKGEPVVQVRNESGENVGRIKVIVPNTPPQMTGTNGIPGTVNGDAGSRRVVIGAPGNTIVGAFTDDDEADKTEDDKGVFNYKVAYKPPELLIETMRGFLLYRNNSADTVTVDAVVLKTIKAPFILEVYAYDRDNDRSGDPVVVNFSAAAEAVTPADGYNLVKGTGTSYKKPKVGNRIGVPHTINLSNTEDDDIADYDFLDDFITADIVKKEILKIDDTYTGSPTPSTVLCEPKAGPPDSISGATKADADGQGNGCWSVKISGREVILGDFILSTKSVKFTLDNDRKLSNADDFTITMGYYVVVKNEADKEPDINKVDEKPLTVDIHRCVDVDDCP